MPASTPELSIAQLYRYADDSGNGSRLCVYQHRVAAKEYRTALARRNSLKSSLGSWTAPHGHFTRQYPDSVEGYRAKILADLEEVEVRVAETRASAKACKAVLDAVNEAFKSGLIR